MFLRGCGIVECYVDVGSRVDAARAASRTFVWQSQNLQSAGMSASAAALNTNYYTDSGLSNAYSIPHARALVVAMMIES